VRLQALALLVAGTVSGCAERTCLDIAADYANERGQALQCDPAAADPCGAAPPRSRWSTTVLLR
jgi:hypothetical protein